MTEPKGAPESARREARGALGRAERAATQVIGVSPTRELLRRFRRQTPAMVALVFLAFVILVAIFAPWIAPKGMSQKDLTHLNEGPSGKYWLGTDNLGKDELSLIIHGSRVSLRAAFEVVGIALLPALVIGLIAGYFRGLVDTVLMRCMDALFAFPPLLLAIVLASLFQPASFDKAMFAVAVVFVPGFARVIRATVLAVREETYIEASRSIGVGPGRMILRHVLPNVASPLIVQIALSLGYAMLAEAGLSFLGYSGINPPQISWGIMLEEAYQTIHASQWQLIPAGLAITVTVLAFNLVGDGLRDALGREAFSMERG